VDGAAAEGGKLSAVLSALDPDGTITATSFQWQENTATAQSPVWANLTGHGATTAALSIPSDQSFVGKSVRVVATTTDVLGGSTAFENSARTIANVNDAPTGAVSISSSSSQRHFLSASNTLADVDGIPGSGAGAITYQWRANGAPIGGATGSTFTLTPAQIGKAVTVTASYTDLGGTAESVTSPAATATREFREFWHDALSRFAGPSQPQVLPPGQDWETLNTSYSTDLARWFGVPLEHGG
jgi:hypothetical protein